MERTGRRRIHYTREELLAGVSMTFRDRLTVYAEGAHGYELRNEDLQEPGRAQAGLQYESMPVWWKGRLRWYAAVDGTATEERNWMVSLTVQAGIVLRADERSWRLGLEHYDGRSWIGEFFQHDERYTSIGLWLDL
jgi:hypothetical protein